MHFIQREIYKNYKMLEIIGEGSFGRVIKALPLNLLKNDQEHSNFSAIKSM